MTRPLRVPLHNKSQDKSTVRKLLPLWLGIGGLIIFGLLFFLFGRKYNPNNLPATDAPTITPSVTLKPATPTATKSLSTETPTFTPGPSIGSTMISEKDGMTLLYVPSGEFTMGSNDIDQPDENPEHQVDLDAFWIDQTEVTNAMYAKCVADGKCAPPSSTHHFKRSSYANHPVVFVNWNKANDYCLWAGRSLPTEAQWEKAARGTDGNIYPWGNDAPNSDLLNFYLYVGGTTQVGSYESGKSVYGAYDMAGNVWEWVGDWYDVYPDGNPNASIDFGQKYRVLRGGSWSVSGYGIRSASRDGYTPVYTDSYVGFRCALSP